MSPKNCLRGVGGAKATKRISNKKLEKTGDSRIERCDFSKSRVSPRHSLWLVLTTAATNGKSTVGIRLFVVLDLDPVPRGWMYCMVRRKFFRNPIYCSRRATNSRLPAPPCRGLINLERCKNERGPIIESSLFEPGPTAPAVFTMRPRRRKVRTSESSIGLPKT